MSWFEDMGIIKNDYKRYKIRVGKAMEGMSIFYCPNCGGYIQSGLIAPPPEEPYKCSVCGNEISWEPGYFRSIVAKEQASKVSFGRKNSPNGQFRWVPEDEYEHVIDENARFGPQIDLDFHFQQMEQIRKNRYVGEAQKIVSVFIDNKLNLINPVNRTDVGEAVKSDVGKLKQYLQKLITIECEVHTATKRLEELHAKKIETEVAINENSFAYKFVEVTAKPLDEEVEQVRKAEIPEFKKALPVEPKEPPKPELQEAGLFNKKKVAKENELIMEEYHKKITAYEEQLEQYKIKVEKWKKEREEFWANQNQKRENELKSFQKRKESILRKSQLVIDKYGKGIEDSKGKNTVEQAQRDFLVEEIREAEEYLIKLLECRSELYALDVVFFKYHSLVPLTTFYEYLETGRCLSLDGATGAYNLYENELRADLIIGQLTTIITSLEEIKENQFVLYNEVQKMNKKIDIFNSSMNSVVESLKSIDDSNKQMAELMETIAHNTDVIAYNTEKTAYYSKVNAELTDSLGFMMALS